MSASVGSTSERYRLYIDESGDHVLHDEAALEQIPHRFLALCGCFFRGDVYVNFHDAWEQLKRKHFPHNPDEPVIMHRKDIINRIGPFWRLRDPVLDQAFCSDMLHLVEETLFIAVIVVIDKLLLKIQYATPSHPYNLALNFMLQRYAGYLNHINRTGDVLAESRGRQEDMTLKVAYRQIHSFGDLYHKTDFYQRVLTSHEIKLKKKGENIAGLQLADVLAYPLRQEVLARHKHIRERSRGFGTQIAEIAVKKLNRELYQDRIEGYGMVLFPKNIK